MVEREPEGLKDTSNRDWWKKAGIISKIVAGLALPLVTESSATC